MLSPFDSKWTRSPFGGAGFPFMVDAQTYWWSQPSAKNTLDTVGSESVAKLAEGIHRVSNATQPNKSLQPLTTADGALYTTTPDTESALDQVFDINGATGIYFGINIKTSSTNHYLMRVENSAGSRNAVTFAIGGLKPNLQFDPDNAGTVDKIQTLDIISNNAWHTVEIYLSLNNAVEIMVDGVVVALDPSYNSPTTQTAFATGTPNQIRIFDSVNAEIQNLVAYNGSIPADNRASISTYLNAQRP